jgi:Uma2 family endonuclease
MTALPKARISEQEYLATERDGLVRHEYIDGEVHAMAGASDRHGLIVSALVYALKPHARRNACQLFSSDMKLKLNLSGKIVFYYPDLVLACDADDNDPYYRTAPKLVIEVLSESTERIDRREKLLSYIRIDSLVEYVIVEQARRSVEIYRRRNDWLPDTVEETGEVKLDSLDCTLTLDDIYADLALLGR